MKFVFHPEFCFCFLGCRNSKLTQILKDSLGIFFTYIASVWEYVEGNKGKKLILLVSEKFAFSHYRNYHYQWHE